MVGAIGYLYLQSYGRCSLFKTAARERIWQPHRKVVLSVFIRLRIDLGQFYVLNIEGRHLDIQAAARDRFAEKIFCRHAACDYLSRHVIFLLLALILAAAQFYLYFEFRQHVAIYNKTLLLC